MQADKVQDGMKDLTHNLVKLDPCVLSLAGRFMLSLPQIPGDHLAD